MAWHACLSPVAGDLGHREQHCAETVGGGGEGWPQGWDTSKTSSLAKSYLGPCSALLYVRRLSQQRLPAPALRAFHSVAVSPRHMLPLG